MPRTLLLTWWQPRSRYASGDVLRKTVRLLPIDKIRWAGLSAETEGADASLPRYRAFPAPRIHWRLSQSLVQYLVVDEMWARIRSERIAAWVKDFDPELLWVFPELEGVAVARHLVRRLNVPMHLTIHDAPQCVSQSAMSPAYVGRFLRNVRALTDRASSLDAVSQPLIDHVRTSRSTSLVYAPSMPTSLMQAPASDPDTGADGKLRKIGLCGSLRVSSEQWRRFIAVLGALPYRFELVIVSAPERYPEGHCPANVTLSFVPYLASETALVEFLKHAGLYACYLGLWREAGRELFVRTSLSSKLSAYAAAGVPVLVDSTGRSAAWQLISRYGAGLLLDENNPEGLTRWLGDVAAWRACAAGSLSLAREHFDLERNVGALQDMLAGA